MKDQIEAMARKAGLIEPTDDWVSIPGEYKASLEVFGALLLENVADEIADYVYADKAEQKIRSLAKELKP